ncbi:MAG: glycoside hydrolase family 3 C-terminal domain-containing protein, partial [Verrucomicrobiales bacterium]|nr:glycoside hydrolase family 3 C-terminal domain-containing protein [Verrucomicrobiales bacterium]
RYTIVIGAVETVAGGPGERLFDVMAGEQVLAKDFDIFATAGGARKVAFVTGTVEKGDDALRGPLQISFVARRSTAKFNTIEIRNAEGTRMVSFSASELADEFTAAARRVPEVKEPPIWRDPSYPLHMRIRDLIRRMSLAEKVEQLQGGMSGAPRIERLGLPAYNYWNEALHGVANNGIATVFPCPIAGAASWNPDMFYQQGRVTGIEGRAKHNDYATKHNGDSKWWTGLTFWTPNINIFRDPRWGRGQETYGEDPFLTGELAVSYVRGLQGDHPEYMLAMACAKHYAVHSGPEPKRHRFNAVVSERDLFETYLPHFERVVREGKVGGIMGAYNAVNGVPCCANPFLLTELLRKRWGFEGYVVSDCDAIANIWRDHRYVKTPEEAAAVAVKAGCNLCCGNDYNALVRAVQKGLITEQEIDQALYHTLWTRFRLGMFDPPERVPFNKYTIKDNDTPEHAKVALEHARQAIVLLKNTGILPLDRAKLRRIAVIGPNARSRTMLHGNYHGIASRPITILDGIKRLAGPGIEVVHAMGCPITTNKARAPWSEQDNETARPIEELRAEALAVVKGADVIIYVGGLTPGQEGETLDRDSIELPEVQRELIRALHATGIPVVMVNCSGSAIALTWEDEHLPAIVQAWYPGQAGGQAVAEVLFGEINPSGHLPITFYRSTADLPPFEDYSMSNRTYRYFTGKPLYAFGHGLHYTKFEYRNGRLSPKKIRPDGKVKLTFAIKNAGPRDGDEVAQVYYRHLNPPIPQPRLALCGFRRVHVPKGKSVTVTLELPAERFRYWDPDQKQYVVAPGQYEILVAAASDDIRITLPLTIVSK